MNDTYAEIEDLMRSSVGWEGTDFFFERLSLNWGRTSSWKCVCNCVYWWKPNVPSRDRKRKRSLSRQSFPEELRSTESLHRRAWQMICVTVSAQVEEAEGQT